ncbi:MAG: AMP-binding protein [Afipia sp.]|nr:AMP-binding protein [Afipia sp.]
MEGSNNSSRGVGPAGVLPRETCVLRYALDRHASERGDAVYAVFQDGTEWTFQELRRLVRTCAAGFHAAGVKQGDRVIIMMPNGPLGVLALFAASYLGAVFVPINPALKGNLLEHVFADSGAAFAVVHEDLLDQVAALNVPALNTIFSSGSVPDDLDCSGRTVLPVSHLNGNPDTLPEPGDPIEPWHTQSIIYTSGTTGRSKGVLSSYMHSYSAMSPETWTCTRAGDRHLLHMPIFHIGGAFVASTCLCTGSSIAVVPAFKTGTFWQTVRDMKVNVVFLLGAMATFLLKSPPQQDDTDHPLRMVFIVPLGQSGPDFQKRFGVEVFTLFNMTEISTPLLSGANPVKPSTCGRPRPGVEVRLVDENDCEVPRGTVGQLVVRTEQPWAMNHGYNGNPQATADAWRNGWFHTGDAFICDGDGDFFFVDRLKDTIRRRGENISSYEIEIELLAHPDIREAAAVPVPSEFTEDEVLVVIAPVAGRSVEPPAIVEFLRARLPHHMIPRYVRIVEELPKTPTEKVQKHVLREQGTTADTWDREATAQARIKSL